MTGRRHLDLQRKAKQSGRPTDELIQLYAFEGFLDRLTHSTHADRFVLKGRVLLAALDTRRPTRDIDLVARVLENSACQVLNLIREVASIDVDDGVVFDAKRTSASPSVLRGPHGALNRRGREGPTGRTRSRRFT